jgi:phosphoenolpyruvate carboxykinase (ATP)
MMERHGADCWLVNTGWSGGSYGVGHRMKIAYTRAMIHAILDGVLAKGEFRVDPNFGLLVPVACPDVPADVLQPKATWGDKKAYDVAAQDVARRFEKNFEQFQGHVDSKVKAAAIRAAA